MRKIQTLPKKTQKLALELLEKLRDREGIITPADPNK